MTKRIFLLFLILLLLSACSPAALMGTAVPATRASAQIGGDFEGALSPQAQLALGTILLDKTNLAVDEMQAYQLLPLWQTAFNLAENGQTANTELSAVTGRIEATLSTEQIAAISAMQLSQSTVDEMIRAGTLKLPPNDLANSPKTNPGLEEIDPTLLEIQGDNSTDKDNDVLSVALAVEVINLLETKVS